MFARALRVHAGVNILYSSDSSESTDGACACVNEEEEDFDWSIEQKLPEDKDTDKVSVDNTVHYGFANQYCGVLAKLQVIFYDPLFTI